MTETSPSAQDPRLSALRAWLHNLPNTAHFDHQSLKPASSDASFRRYFRLHTSEATHPTLIVMDAPPAHEDCRPFVAIAHLFAEAGVQVPTVLEKDIEQGFLLLSDLGTETYEQALNPSSAAALYAEASEALLKIQSASQANILPPYNEALLRQELNLFEAWYLNHHSKLELSSTEKNELQQVYLALLANNLGQGCVYVHRDYHCRNLMVNQRHQPGILDFQDAVYGPITYDLVSLWRDAYIDWEEALQLDWLARYWEKAKQRHLPVASDFGDFYRDYEWMGLQRHLKVLGIFARLSYRDGKHGYLQYLPRVLHYVRQVAERYGEFKPLLRLLDKTQDKPAQVGYTF